jgi:carboxyl-terminal processing protease
MVAMSQVGSGKKRLHRWIKWPAVVLVAFLIFAFGVGVGDGHINIGLDRLGRFKPVSHNLPTNLDYSSIEQVYDSLKTNFDGQLGVDKLLDGLKQGIATASGDPYTEYFNPKAAQDFNDELSGTFTGIGAELGKDASNNIVVIAPLAGFPAEKAGLRPKDIIVQIDGKSTAEMTISQAVDKIRGPKDTKVTLKVVRNSSQQLNITITRAVITVPSVTHKILKNNIGYLKISRFGEDTTQLARQAAQEFKQKDVKGIVLDLRSDPGGLLEAAVNVSSLWLPTGKTVLTERRDNVIVRSYEATGSAVLRGIPTIVLIDAGSASASEITAGALHDNDAATLIGVKSFGKGSVQQIVNFGDGSELKVTVARWYTPNGRNIDKQGIEPDKKVTRSDADFKANKDPQLDAALATFK